MARARNIKPGFFQNDLLAEITPLGRLLFAGLWTIADRAGRLEDRPKRIKAAVLPYDECDVDELLSELEQKAFVVRYCVESERFIQVQNFVKHQNPHCKEPESTIPAPDLHCTSPVLISNKNGSSHADSLLLIPDSLSTDAPGNAPASGERDDPVGFWECWDIYPKREGGNSRTSAARAFRARLKAGASSADLLAGVTRYATYCEAKGIVGTSYIKQAASFFGPDQHWLESWEFQIEEKSPLAPDVAAGAI